jgi:hypothetical protein
MVTTSLANRLSIFTDGGFISPSVPMDNLYLPMVNWLTIGTDGQCFGGLPYAIAIMLKRHLKLFQALIGVILEGQR